MVSRGDDSCLIAPELWAHDPEDGSHWIAGFHGLVTRKDSFWKIVEG